MGLDKPLPVQYLIWLGKAVTGDWGVSIVNGRPAFEAVIERVPVTMQMTAGGFVFAAIFGIPLGIVSAVYRGTLLGLRIGRTFAILGQSLPAFLASYRIHRDILGAVRVAAHVGQGNHPALHNAVGDTRLAGRRRIPAPHPLGDARRDGLRVREVRARKGRGQDDDSVETRAQKRHHCAAHLRRPAHGPASPPAA